MARSTVTISHSTPQATAQPGRPARANATVPTIAQTRPQTLSHRRSRRALRAVVGSLPVRIGITTPTVKTYSSWCTFTKDGGTTTGSNGAGGGSLRADERLAGWLRDLESEGEPDGPRVEASLPDADDAAGRPARPVRAAHEYVNELVALRARLVADPEAMTLLRRCVAPVRTGHGGDRQRVGAARVPGVRPERWGAASTVYVFVAALPVRARLPPRAGCPGRRVPAHPRRPGPAHGRAPRRVGTSGLLVALVDRAALPRGAVPAGAAAVPAGAARRAHGEAGRRAAGLRRRPRTTSV